MEKIKGKGKTLCPSFEKVFKKHIFHQAVQKHSDARRASTEE
jgi:hypothetical protein